MFFGLSGTLFSLAFKFPHLVGSCHQELAPAYSDSCHAISS
jgi:hypothetical protein